MDGQQNKLNFERKEDGFIAALGKLNDMQRRAVETIEGPVLVLAGPGSGKTEVLAIRIGYILTETDAQAQNILCLTYTEAGAVAMRNRLIQYLGPEAYKIDIFTFHGFCNKVIQENLDIFGGYFDYQPLSKLEEIDVMQKIIDDLKGDNPLKRLHGDYYLHKDRIFNLIQMMKKENWGVDYVIEKIKEYIDDIPQKPEFLYKRKYTDKKSGITYQAGDLKTKLYNDEVIKCSRIQAAAELLSVYQDTLASMKRYDFMDMLVQVHQKFSSDENLLLNYQERYQYILVDEYQDTNEIQNNLVDQLCSYWDRPNVFVVGDDDQAIFRFQGANVSNIVDFHSKYAPQLIVLNENYRSSQKILEASHQLINLNEERLGNKLEKITKEMSASGVDAAFKEPPFLLSFTNSIQEEAAIVKKIFQLRESGEDLSDIGVIYRSHKQAERIIQLLEKQGVPVNVVQKVNLLNEPFANNLLLLLQYISDERKKPFSRPDLLFELMHFPYFGIKAIDAARIALALRKHDKEGDQWRAWINESENLNSIELGNPKSVKDFSDNLEYWIQHAENMTVQVLFEKVLMRGGVVQYILQSDQREYLLQMVTTLFDFIKEETSRNPLLGISGLIEIIAKMRANKIKLFFNRIIKSEAGVNFMTAHGSKGLQFKHVFIKGCSSNFWEKKRINHQANFKLPETFDAHPDANIEDERRLFFVALTRAKTHVYVSWANEDNGRERVRSQFVEEIISATGLEPQKVEVPKDQVVNYFEQWLSPEESRIELFDHNLIDRVLENFKVSVTSLNKYLTCPIAFYFEKILRIPSARTKYLGFGNAIHFALDRFFRKKKKTGRFEGPEILVKYFQEGMEKYASHFTAQEYENEMAYGVQTLPQFYKQYIDSWEKVEKFESEYSIRETHFEGVPISGKLDKVEIFSDHVVVVDYKTGNPESQYVREDLKEPSDKKVLGGNYWRQMVFYKMLLQSDKHSNWSMTNGYFDFVQPGKDGSFFRKPIVVTPDHMRVVTAQLVDSYKKIKNHEFENGCAKEDCVWCNFVKYNVMPQEMPVQLEEEN